MKSLKLVVLSALCLGTVTSIYPTLGWMARKAEKEATDLRENREIREGRTLRKFCEILKERETRERVKQHNKFLLSCKMKQHLYEQTLARQKNSDTLEKPKSQYRKLRKLKSQKSFLPQLLRTMYGDRLNRKVEEL